MADFLRRLVDAGELSGVALGLARLVIAGGEGALTGRQRFLFQRLVLDPYGNRVCPRHGYFVPWPEMYEFHAGGTCRYCRRDEDGSRDG